MHYFGENAADPSLKQLPFCHRHLRYCLLSYISVKAIKNVSVSRSCMFLKHECQYLSDLSDNSMQMTLLGLLKTLDFH